MNHMLSSTFRIVALCLVNCLYLVSSPVQTVMTTETQPLQRAIQTSQIEQHTKATWLWNTVIIRDQQEDILSFAASQKINVIYLQMNPDIRQEYYQQFIREAGLKGIQVHALHGAPAWALTSERAKLEYFMNWIAEYQVTVAPEERFTGIHVDIEPHVLKEWTTSYDSLIKQWQSNVRYLVEEAHKLELPITADIPFWLHKYSIPGESVTVSRWMMEQFDEVAIMAYRDQADNIYNVAAQELAEADDAGIRALVAVETSASSEGEFITFYEEGLKYMEEQLDIVESLARQHPSFSGIAIHEYRSLKQMTDQ